MGNSRPFIKEIVLGKIAGVIYWVYSRTFRYRYHFAQSDTRSILSADVNTKPPHYGSNHLYALWHQDEMSVLPAFCGKNIMVMSSLSRDGTIMASALHLLGYQTVRGSSNKNPISVLMKAIKMVSLGHKMAIAVDGPRGPIYKVKDGIIMISTKAKRPIIPFRAIPTFYISFKRSWNKARLPLPFSTIDLYIGTPNFYSKEDLEKTLMELPGSRAVLF